MIVLLETRLLHFGTNQAIYLNQRREWNVKLIGMRCRRSCTTANQAAGRWDPRAGQSGGTQSSRGHEDIVHFVWLKCVCVYVTCRAGWLEDRSTFPHSNWSLISCNSPRAERGPVPTTLPQASARVRAPPKCAGLGTVAKLFLRQSRVVRPKSKRDPTFIWK